MVDLCLVGLCVVLFCAEACGKNQSMTCPLSLRQRPTLLHQLYIYKCIMICLCTTTTHKISILPFEKMCISQLLFFSFILSAYVANGEMDTDTNAYSPRVADTTVFEGDGGSYHSWSSSNFPLLGESKVGAGILLLHPHGFALPHYADSNKIGYVLQGSCTVGMVSPSASKEKVVVIKEGDAIPVPIGLVSWWFNAGDSDTVIVFIGETSISQISGEMTYFFLTGTVGVLRGFSMEFISKAYNLNQNEANTLVTNQTGGVVVKLSEGIQIPQPQNYAKNYDEFASTLTTAVEFTSLEQVGLSFKHLKLGRNAVFQPVYVTDSVQVAYVIRGSGRVQFAGANGEKLLDATVKAGELFVVPRFVVAIEIADAQGMEYLSVITSSKPVIWELSGKTSIWKAFSPVILQVSLSVSPEFARIFLAKMTNNMVPMPP
ncbi:12S seed storage globulin 2-like isoform X1 [Rhododendron vialii]|uniref:12S seed storage globulin 2-like isoform X1 n=1 Tax=Rhododendron vialii TaxID=182163 RepID=UPI00265D6AC5|nr:12S seed storage globulin 2-like isoform X1 [Rhododendron vialii]